MNREEKQITCAVCHDEKPATGALPLEVVRPAIQALIRQDFPAISPTAYICAADLNRYRLRYIEGLLETDTGVSSEVHEDVVNSLKDHELLASNANDEYEDSLTFGERLADSIASFGGSWTFILLFFGAMVAWVGLNTAQLLARPFDPYPYILLNLLLSTLAALQAPVIMMSQNRQEAKDRVRAEGDYKVNLKAELEIRQMHEKMDHLMELHWRRHLELQHSQLQLLEEVRRLQGLAGKGGAGDAEVGA